MMACATDLALLPQSQKHEHPRHAVRRSVHNNQSHPRPIMHLPSSPNTLKYEIPMTYSTLTCVLRVTPFPSTRHLLPSAPVPWNPQWNQMMNHPGHRPSPHPKGSFGLQVVRKN